MLSDSLATLALKASSILLILCIWWHRSRGSRKLLKRRKDKNDKRNMQQTQAKWEEDKKNFERREINRCKPSSASPIFEVLLEKTVWMRLNYSKKQRAKWVNERMNKWNESGSIPGCCEVLELCTVCKLALRTLHKTDRNSSRGERSSPFEAKCSWGTAEPGCYREGSATHLVSYLLRSNSDGILVRWPRNAQLAQSKDAAPQTHARTHK